MASFNVRRASVDDLTRLRELWASRAIANADSRVTEFQIAEETGGKILGAVGLQIDGQQGRLHSAVFAPGPQAAEVKAALWQRLQTVANNNGLTRLWATEMEPFWGAAAFTITTPDHLRRLPSSFGPQTSSWQTLQLRDDTAPRLSVEQELALFRDSERESTERLFQQAKLLKITAFVVAGVVLILVLIAGFWFMKNYQKRGGPNPAGQPP